MVPSEVIETPSKRPQRLVLSVKLTGHKMVRTEGFSPSMQLNVPRCTCQVAHSISIYWCPMDCRVPRKIKSLLRDTGFEPVSPGH